MVTDYKFSNPDKIDIEEFRQLMNDDSTPMSKLPTPFLQNMPANTDTDFTTIA
jgi:hypothetical protein